MRSSTGERETQDPRWVSLPTGLGVATQPSAESETFCLAETLWVVWPFSQGPDPFITLLKTIPAPPSEGFLFHPLTVKGVDGVQRESTGVSRFLWSWNKELGQRHVESGRIRVMELWHLGKQAALGHLVSSASVESHRCCSLTRPSQHPEEPGPSLQFLTAPVVWVPGLNSLST